MNSASTSISDCECEKGYYNQRSAANNTVVCGLCPVGSACLDVGITLDTLPLLPGYYRSSDRSNDLRRCPDFGAGSGCVGGVADGHGPCKQWLTGPYCRLCNVTDVSRYYNIEESACLPCEANTMVIPLVICGAIIAGIAVSLCCRRFRKRCNVPSLVRLSRKLRRLLSHLSLRAKMKQLLGFYQIATRVSDVYETPMPEVSPRPPQPYGSKPKPNPNPNKPGQAVARLLSVFDLLNINVGGVGLPLQCLGIGTYQQQLATTMLAPLVVAGVVVLVFILRSCYGYGPKGKRAGMLRALPWLLMLSFMVFPVVSSDLSVLTISRYAAEVYTRIP